MKPHETIEKAIKALSKARGHFLQAKEEGHVLGNDNHIGDIGEYWVKELLTQENRFSMFAKNKNSPYDIELVSGEKVSVKTLTSWSERGKGTQIKPLCGEKWSILMAVFLDDDLKPIKIAEVNVGQLLSHEPFISNKMRREQENGTKAYPRYQWWSWLDQYLVYENVAESDI